MNETFLAPITAEKVIIFDCPTELARSRAQTLLTKEPGTIAWIDSFATGSVFWDVGANVGVYSLYAAIARDCRVIAFEPSAANYYGLNTNIRLNLLAERQVQALCICLGEEARADFLHMQDSRVGGALHTFGEPIDYKGDRFAPTSLQGSLSLPIDELVERFRLPFPAYIKIDVDGTERRIINGARRTLADRRLVSVLVEIDLNDEIELSQISAVLEAAGLKCDNDVPGNKPRPLDKALIYNLIYRR
jgi:FkbM family methyltransferase